MHITVLNTGKSKAENYWVLIQTEFNVQKYHAVVYSITPRVINETIEFPKDKLKTIDWQLSGNPNRFRLFPTGGKPNRSKKGFDKNTVLNFGLYRNYELGIVYAFDFKYIEWCIFNVEEFYLNDIEELIDIGVYRESGEYEENRDIHFAEYYSFIKEFRTIQKLDETLGILNSSFRLSDRAIKLNNLKLERSDNNNR